MERIPKGFPLNLKQLTRVGKFVVKWAEADLATNELLVTLLGIDWHDAIPFIFRLELGAKLDALAVLIKKRNFPEDKRNKLDEAITYLKSKNKDRNMIVHGYWLYSKEETAGAINYRKAKPLEIGMETYELTTSELDDLISGTRVAGKKIGAINYWLDHLEKPLRKKFVKPHHLP